MASPVTVATGVHVRLERSGSDSGARVCVIACVGVSWRKTGRGDRVGRWSKPRSARRAREPQCAGRGDGVSGVAFERVMARLCMRV